MRVCTCARLSESVSVFECVYGSKEVCRSHTPQVVKFVNFSRENEGRIILICLFFYLFVLVFIGEKFTKFCVYNSRHPTVL